MISGQSMVLGGAAASPNGKAPRCEHLDGLPTVTPQSADCRDCRDGKDGQDGQHGKDGKDGKDGKASLVACLTCGWVACSDDMPNQHARAHYQETDHPVAASLALGTAWRWCYVHERLV